MNPEADALLRPTADAMSSEGRRFWRWRAMICAIGEKRAQDGLLARRADAARVGTHWSVFFRQSLI
jgi:hypothetical protein